MNPENMNPEFTSSMTLREQICALIWFPVHLFLMPRIAFIFLEKGAITESQANLLIYAVGALYMLITCFRFLRKDFDPVCDRPLYCLGQIFLCYCMMMAFNIVMSVILSFLETLLGNSALLENQNNAAIIDLALKDTGTMTAMAVFLAPITEEVMFRGAVFGFLRKKSRFAAYLVSMLLFSVYHIWAYALSDPTYWIYMLQYLPAAFLLCRCYERTNSILCSISFHMLINMISMRALMLLEELL